MNYLIAFAVSLTLSLLLTPMLIKIAHKFGCVAKPSQARWHKNTTVLLGGVAIFVSFVVCVFLFVKIDIKIIGLLTGASVIFLIGLADDILQIRPQLKLIGQIFAACIIVAFGITFEIITIKWIVIPLTIFWIVGISNAFNLLDNMDGLSCGIAFITSAFLAVYSLLNGMHNIALLSLILAASSLGFLRYNFYPARIFMGDCGSQFLGLAIATLAIMGTSRHVSNLVVTLAIPVLILSVPIFDTIFVTLVRRFRGQPISQGGKDHTSHRLVFLGLSERKTVLLLYLLSLLFGLIALLYATMDLLIVSILAILAIIVLYFFGVFLSETKIYSDKGIQALKKMEPNKTKTVLNTIFLHKRRIVEVIIDVFLICISYYAAYLLRFGGNVSYIDFSLITASLPWLIVFRLGCFYYFGLYQGIWRYIGIKDVVAIFKAISASSILTILFLTLSFRFQHYSRGVFIIDWMLILLLSSGARILIRVLRESFLSLKAGETKVLIFGAGDAGEMVLREIRHNKSLNYHPIGFLDDNPKKIGRKIHGIAVLGTRDKLAQVVKEKGVQEVIVAISSLKAQDLGDFLKQCQDCGVKYKRMRGILWE